MPANLLYVFPDQFRQSSMGFWRQHGNYPSGQPDPVHTPHLDALASQATIVTGAVSNCPVCSPHRGSLMTANYPNRSGVPLNCHSGRPQSQLPADMTCLTDVLAEQNYHIGYIGKWHLDWPTPNDPANPGHYVEARRPAWDSYTEPARRHGIHYWYGYGTFDEHHNPHYYDSEGNRHEPGEWSARHETDKAIEYLQNRCGERDPDKPFALFVSMNPPHSPYNSERDCDPAHLPAYLEQSIPDLLVRDNADTAMEKSGCAPYYFANVSAVDEQFGRIVAELKAMGEWDNTLVVFSSDHGETLCAQGIQDAKNCIYHEAFSVPFVLKRPHQQQCDFDDLLISSPDIMPTLLGSLGIGDRMPPERHGRDLSACLGQPQHPDRPQCALYIRNLDGITEDYFPESRGIKTGRYTLALTISRHHSLTRTLFFDDSQDPYQQNNLMFDPQGETERQLLSLMAKELHRIDDPWAERHILCDLLPYPNEKESQ